MWLAFVVFVEFLIFDDGTCAVAAFVVYFKPVLIFREYGLEIF